MPLKFHPYPDFAAPSSCPPPLAVPCMRLPCTSSCQQQEPRRLMTPARTTPHGRTRRSPNRQSQTKSSP